MPGADEVYREARERLRRAEIEPRDRIDEVAKDGDDVRHVYPAHPPLADRERGIDLPCPVWDLFDLIPSGRGDGYAANEAFDTRGARLRRKRRSSSERPSETCVSNGLATTLRPQPLPPSGYATQAAFATHPAARARWRQPLG